MTEATAQHPATDQASMSSPRSLAQENAYLQRRLADQEHQLAALQATMDRLVDERLVELATLQEIDLQIHARLDAEHVMHAVLAWAMQVTSAVAGTLYLLDESDQRAVQRIDQRGKEQKMLRIVAQHGYQPPMQEYEHQQWPIGHDILAHALETGQVVRQIYTSQGHTRASRQDQERAHLAVPIRYQDTLVGIFGLESPFADGFTPAQIDSVNRLADHGSLAIQNALHHQQTHQHLDELLAVHQSCLNLTSHLNLDTLPGRIVQNALDVLDVNRAAVYRHDSAADKFVLAAAANRDDNPEPETDPSEHTLVESAARDHTTCLGQGSTANAIAALPLTAHTRPKTTGQPTQDMPGILYLSFRTHADLPPEMSTLIHLFADYAASALQNAQQITRHQQALDVYQDRQSRIVSQSRAPLTSIQGYAKLMLQQIGGGITDQQREFLETILKNARHLEALIGDTAAS